MKCFVTYNLSLAGKLQSLFSGCGLSFGISGFGASKFVYVTLPRRSVAEQSSLLDDVYRHANRLNA